MNADQPLFSQASLRQRIKPLVLIVLVLGAGGWWLLRQWGDGSAGPAAAAAKGLGAPAANDSPERASLTGSTADPLPDPVTGAATNGNGTGSSDPVAVWLAGPIVQPDRDLFFSPTMVSPPPRAKGTTPVQVDDDNEQRKTSAFRLAVAELKLTSVVGGPGGSGTGNVGQAPMALLNGRWVTSGDQIDGFKVVRIDPRAVVVERDGRLLEVRMK